MAKNKNSYEKKAQKKQLLEGVAARHAKGDLKKAALETGRDIVIGAIGGGLAGAALGRSSFLVGIAVTGVGHYMGSNGAAAFGVGLMASGGYQAVAGTINGTEKEGFEGVKERLTAFKEDFKRKLFLDKIIKAKKSEEKTDEATNGVGDVQYFTYPQKELEGANENTLDLSALERIEKQVADAAQKFENKQSVSGDSWTDDHIGMLDVAEQNL